VVLDRPQDAHDLIELVLDADQFSQSAPVAHARGDIATQDTHQIFAVDILLHDEAAGGDRQVQ
jgi:hypothetical protein